MEKSISCPRYLQAYKNLPRLISRTREMFRRFQLQPSQRMLGVKHLEQLCSLSTILQDSFSGDRNRQGTSPTAAATLLKPRVWVRVAASTHVYERERVHTTNFLSQWEGRITTGLDPTCLIFTQTWHEMCYIRPKIVVLLSLLTPIALSLLSAVLQREDLNYT